LIELVMIDLDKEPALRMMSERGICEIAVFGWQHGTG